MYFLGQLGAVTGVWVQVVALAWLVLDLTGSGTSLGLVVGSRFLPVLLLGPYGGLLADRLDKRALLLRTQAVTALLAFTLGVLATTDVVQVWMVYLVAVGLGLVTVLDNPARQSFISELVPSELVRNAVTLNSVMIYIAQVIGPALAGVVISVAGVGPCFVLSALSGSAVLVSLAIIDPERLHRIAPVERGKGQIRAGLTYVGRTPELRATMIMIAVGGIFAWEFQITIPLLAKETFAGDAGTVGLFMACMGAGAVVGGLLAASRPNATARSLALACVLWGATLCALAAAPTRGIAVVAMLLVGFGTVAFSATSKSTLQLASVPEMRGRVMALWSVAVGGTTPIGAPIVGWIGEHLGARWSLIAGGLPTLVVGAVFYVSFRAHPAPADTETVAGAVAATTVT